MSAGSRITIHLYIRIVLLQKNTLTFWTIITITCAINVSGSCIILPLYRCRLFHTRYTVSLIWADLTPSATEQLALEKPLSRLHLGGVHSARAVIVAECPCVHPVRPSTAICSHLRTTRAMQLQEHAAMQPPIVSSSSSFRWSCSSWALCSACLQVSERRR